LVRARRWLALRGDRFDTLPVARGDRSRPRRRERRCRPLLRQDGVLMSFDEQLEYLADLKRRAALGGGQDRIDAQHERGKMTARERIAMLVDPGTFEEIDALAVDWSENESTVERDYGEAVVTGWGRVEGRPVYVFAQD